MNTTHPHAELHDHWRAQRAIAFLLLALSGALLVLMLPALHFTSSVSLPSTNETQPMLRELPFTFDELVDYFVRDYRVPVTERQENYAAFALPMHGGSMSEFTITRQSSNILLRFRVEDEYAMGTVRDFCKAPLFQPEERTVLSALLGAGNGIHCAFLQRFDVVCEYQMQPDATLISFYFAPPLRYCPIDSAPGARALHASQ